MGESGGLLEKQVYDRLTNSFACDGLTISQITRCPQLFSSLLQRFFYQAYGRRYFTSYTLLKNWYQINDLDDSYDIFWTSKWKN